MRERIDISEVEAQTKIRAKYLRAIENEEWDLLPGPVYAKSFLRTYGDYLGLDSRMLLDEFKRRYERPSEHDIRPMGRVAARDRSRDRDRDRRPRRVRAPSWAPIGVVVIAVLAILYIVGSLPGSGSTTTSTQTQPVHHHRPKTVTQPRPAPPAVPASVSLQLVPTNTVYVCLVNGRGTKLINEQTFNVGQTIPSQTAHKLLLTLGNASVQMKVNGKAIPVAPSPTAIRLLITPTQVQHIPNSQIPTCP
ncbi:MAG: helix-turn-helix domain-containing protein [Solirubrobacterales bacterium]|nr:helix-turn-helix domain-containing protein [Solirubrobacterales bacterium]